MLQLSVTRDLKNCNSDDWNMDEQTKELARQYMEKVSGSIVRNEKFPFMLPDERTMTAKLLGWYGTMVRSRDVEFLMDDSTVSKVDKVVKWMYESRKRGLLLCGTLGNGKTTMLRAVKYLFGTRAVYVESQAVYEYFKQNRSIPSISPRDILLIDDMGVEPAASNDFGDVRYPLTELLLSRYKSNSTTVIATNLTFDEIGEVYGERIQDRMREMFSLIKYVEPSYR